MVSGKMPPGKKPPGKMPPRKLPPRKLPPGNKPPRKLPPGKKPPGKMPPRKIAPRKIASQENCFTRFLLLLTLSYSSSFSNFLASFRGVSRTLVVSIIDLLVTVVNGSN